MLVLTRKVGERLFIGDSIVVKVVRVEGSSVRIAVGAPREIGIFREELLYEAGGDGSGRERAPTPAGRA